MGVASQADPSRSNLQLGVIVIDEPWIEFRPKWCPHVRGEYTPRVYDPDAGQMQQQKWRATCEKCNEKWGPVLCDSGMVTQHIARFALAHLHRDPLDPLPPK